MGSFVFRWWQWHFESQLTRVAMEGRSNVVWRHMCHFKSHFWWDFLAYCTRPICGMCWLLVRQFVILFAQLKTTAKSHENDVFPYPFSNMAISPQNNEKKRVFYTGKLYGLTWQGWFWLQVILVFKMVCNCSTQDKILSEKLLLQHTFRGDSLASAINC